MHIFCKKRLILGIGRDDQPIPKQLQNGQTDVFEHDIGTFYVFM